MKRLAAIAIALAAVTWQAQADYHEGGKGFTTTPCTLPAGAPMPGSGAARPVGPSGYATIQAAVDAALPGDTVLIPPGVYNEAVVVTTPGLRIRGLDRNTTILDGGSTLDVGIRVQNSADRVVIENLTAHNYTRHGFYWFNVIGYWGRYLTAYNNGLYGIYAYDARCGQLDHSYASGNADSGFYIGECFPCDAVIHDIEAAHNALGYSGTNAGGGLILRDSSWHHNGLGIVPNSLDGEERPPQRGAIISQNDVIDNSNRTAPGTGLAGDYFGAGIVIAGGNANQVYGNTVTGHELSGIAVVPLPDQNLWIPSGNTVWGNYVRGPEGSFDLAQAAASGPGNCWADNDNLTSAPPEIETVWDCGLTITPPGGDARAEALLVVGAAGLNGRAPRDWRTYTPTPPTTLEQSPGGQITAWLPALF